MDLIDNDVLQDKGNSDIGSSRGSRSADSDLVERRSLPSARHGSTLEHAERDSVRHESESLQVGKAVSRAHRSFASQKRTNCVLRDAALEPDGVTDQTRHGANLVRRVAELLRDTRGKRDSRDTARLGDVDFAGFALRELVLEKKRRELGGFSAGRIRRGSEHRPWTR